MSPGLTEAREPARGGVLRSAGAVLAGLAFIVVTSTITDQVLHSTGVYPPVGQRMSDGLFVLATAYRVVFAVAGCWLTARLAADRPMWHAMMLAIVGLVISTAGAVYALQHPELGPAWYPLGLIATTLPCAWLGARLAGSSTSRGSTASAG